MDVMKERISIHRNVRAGKEADQNMKMKDIFFFLIHYLNMKLEINGCQHIG